MPGFICSILAFVIFAILGAFVFRDACRNKVPMFITPWPSTTSWLCYVALMISMISNVILTFRLMNGG